MTILWVLKNASNPYKGTIRMKCEVLSSSWKAAGQQYQAQLLHRKGNILNMCVEYTIPSKPSAFSQHLQSTSASCLHKYFDEVRKLLKSNLSSTKDKLSTLFYILLSHIGLLRAFLQLLI